MSTLTRNFGGMEHASVALPSVKCTSCSDSIPLSSLGEHVCRPASRSTQNRSIPRPSQIAIPTPSAASSAGSWRGPSSLDRAPPRPAFAGPSSVRSSPGSGSLMLPDVGSGHSSPVERLSPHTGSSPSPRTPSPTNPFFPSLPMDNKGALDLGLGLTVSSRPEGPFPTDAPLPAGVSDLSGLATNTGAGMAGVGRRAFQAAAWGVTAGVSMANSVRNRPAEPAPTARAPWGQPSAPVSAPMTQRSRRGADVRPPPVETSAPIPQRSASAMDRPIEPVTAPPRSTSAMAQHNPTHQSRPSIASRTSSRSSYEGGDGIAQLLKARQPEKKNSNERAFFDRYKEVQRSNSKSSDGTSRLMPEAREAQEIVTSPQQTVLSLEEDEEGSALPWATPALEASPRIKPIEFAERKHHRQPTAESGSSGSSSRSGAEHIVTPSQSLEGIPVRKESYTRPLKQIHESDEENERVTFGMPRSESTSTIATKSTHLQAHSHSRSRTAPVRKIKTCAKCGETVGGARKFVERDGVVLCEADWKKMYLPSCRRCNKLIETKMVSADDGQLRGKWHSACFTCTRCEQPFENGDFYVHAGRPWCQYHYAQETGTLCAASSCRRPIEGACILTQGANPQRYHPGHLKCDHEGCRDSMEEYYDVAGQRVCERHLRVATSRLGDRERRDLRAEKRKTRLVDLPKGGF